MQHLSLWSTGLSVQAVLVQGVLVQASRVQAVLVPAVLLQACLWSGCSNGHAVPGTRDGSFDIVSDAGDVGDGDGDGDGDGAPDPSVPIDDASTGEPEPPPPAVCNVSMCQGATSLLGETPACCTDTNVCGLDFAALGLDACLQRDAPGPQTTQCPATSVFGLINLPGCCPPSGECGLWVQDFLPLGCVGSDVGLPIPGAMMGGAPVLCVPPGNGIE